MQYVGYFALIIGIIVRIVVALVNDNAIVDINSMQVWEKYFYTVCLLLFSLSFWNHFIRLRCKKCKSTNVRQVNKQLLSSKIVSSPGHSTGGTSHGNIRRTTYEDKTKVDEFQITYECNDCKNIWAQKKKEKTNLGRITTSSSIN